jgi:hypothetical protein
MNYPAASSGVSLRIYYFIHRRKRRGIYPERLNRIESWFVKQVISKGSPIKPVLWELCIKAFDQKSTTCQKQKYLSL